MSGTPKSQIVMAASNRKFAKAMAIYGNCFPIRNSSRVVGVT